MYYLAIDIGASSGRHILGEYKEGRIFAKEIYRFETKMIRNNNHLCWDIDLLFENVLRGLQRCKELGYEPDYIGIDTWAVDFVLVDNSGKRLTDAVAYRDNRTDGIRLYLKKERNLSFDEHYKKTGIQYQKFNTIYQLVALYKENAKIFDDAYRILMIPDYLNFLLTGKMANEYTNATTTGLVNAEAKTWDFSLIEKANLPTNIFGEIVTPGTVIGNFTSDIKDKIGFDTKVVLPATHDTGSAFISVPVKSENSVIISSGTWSLLGIENDKPNTNDLGRDKNFTNEGGYEYRYRYLKNIMGLWMIQNIRKEYSKSQGREVGFAELIDKCAHAKSIGSRVDPDDDRFLSPESMTEEIKKALKESGQKSPSDIGELLNVVYESLAEDYKRAICDLEAVTGKKFDSVNIVGGGSRDSILNQITADKTKLKVYAGPTEATALGNLIVQMIASGDIASLCEARKIIEKSFEITEVIPK
ncbi:MAG: rhamnulokinase [Lachnospiraceae bacterium]|nr:rhamnulokinase [Lachnospiraceae bacterium]